MTLAEKFKGFNPEQQEKLLAIETAEELDAFLAETDIVFSGEEKSMIIEYINTGVAPLNDDDLEAVAGGQSKEDSEMRARADGRKINLPAGGGHCGNSCHHKHKWAVKVTYTKGSDYWDYHDVKCYKCGVWKAVHRSIIKYPGVDCEYL